MARIICALFVAAAVTVWVSAPSAAAPGCYAPWEGNGSFIACEQPVIQASGAPWTWAFVAGWTSIVALLLLADRCARRREPDRPLGASHQAS